MTLYQGCRVEAVVDWINVQVHLETASNGGSLNRFCNLERGINAHFSALDKGPGQAATMFVMSIQDPSSWHHIQDVLDTLDAVHPFAATPVVTAIEVSLDAYADGATVADLAELTARRYRFMQRDVSDNHRFSGRKGRKLDVEGIWLPSIEKHLANGRNIVIGDRLAEKSQRLYVKTTDKGGEIQLDREQWRSRMELTLRGVAVPFDTIEEGREFKFESLSKYFATRAPRDDLESFQRMVLDRRPQPGSRRKEPVKRRWYASSTIADGESNAIAYSALRKLSRHMNPRQRGGYRRTVVQMHDTEEGRPA